MLYASVLADTTVYNPTPRGDKSLPSQRSKKTIKGRNKNKLAKKSRKANRK
jgi:hypothetical protein